MFSTGRRPPGATGPKVVRVACPWLVRRFVDPAAAFLFVPPSEVGAVATRFGATPFDAGTGEWDDRGGLCTFDVMLEGFGLAAEPLGRDRARRGHGPVRLGAPGSGLARRLARPSRAHRDDLAQLEAAMPL